nr:hypothetical protein [Vampirovibrio sp.]
IPNTGYVAVGIVEKYVQPVSEFYVKDELGHDVRLLDQPIQAHMGEHCGNPDLEEQVVGITWLRTLTKENAFREQGFFTANQQSVCKFRNQFTLDKLIERFGVAQDLTEHPVFF